MDKLRALEYFVAAADEGSFSAAARRLEVSMPAVLKLVNGLEQELGASLFDRSSRGLALTADGSRFLDRCRPVLEELADASRSIGPAAMPRGQVVVGIAPFEQHVVSPALPEFNARFPDIELDIRPMRRVTEADAAWVDVFVMAGWQDAPGLITKVICQSQYCVVASPAHWSSRGIPKRPKDLEEHTCLIYRSAATLLDVWEFERGEEKESAQVRGWLATGSREILLDAALAGAGVMRARKASARPFLASGRLVPVLQDWNAKHAPPVAVLFRPKHRRTARIKVFVDFVTDVFQRLEPRRAASTTDRVPAWWSKRYSRISTAGR